MLDGGGSCWRVEFILDGAGRGGGGGCKRESLNPVVGISEYVNSNHV